MDLEELEPRKKKPKLRNLDEMSVEALEEYIADLEAEIARAESAIKAKQSARLNAESVFKR